MSDLEKIYERVKQMSSIENIMRVCGSQYIEESQDGLTYRVRRSLPYGKPVLTKGGAHEEEIRQKEVLGP